MDKYLKETKMLDYSNANIQQLIRERRWKNINEFERLKSIYDFVRDEILFGYNIDDNVPASKVLADGYGQCNTKGTLFMALLRACNIPCRVLLKLKFRHQYYIQIKHHLLHSCRLP